MYMRISRIILIMSLCMSHSRTMTSSRRSLAAEVTVIAVDKSLCVTHSVTPWYSNSPCLCSTNVYEFLHPNSPLRTNAANYLYNSSKRSLLALPC